MSNAAKNKLLTTPNLARIAVLAAVASVLFLIEIPLGMPFYKLDLSNIPVLIGAFSMGPVAGVLILGLKSLIGLTHSSSAGVGELADFIMGLAMILPAGLIYQRNKTRRTALLGMLCGMICAVVISVFVNKWIMLPFYMGAFHMSMEELVAAAHWGGVDSEWKLLLMITAPFNLIKGGINATLTVLLYKPIVNALRKAKLVEPSSGKGGKSKVGVALVAAVLFVTFVLLALVLAKVI